MLKNKVTVVTGGAGLLGKEFARAILEQNGVVVIADINTEAALLVKDNLSKTFDSSKIETITLDITSKPSIVSLIEYLNTKYGKIDGLVNNAYPRNKNYGKHFFDVTYSDFVENLGFNLGGYFLMSQQFSEYFLKQGYGNIINISSIYGVIPPRFEIYENTQMTTPVEYAAIKSGLIHLTKYMAKYFKGKNIRVNAISLGGIKDKQPEIFLEKYKSNCLNKGMLDNTDISGTLIYLLSEHSKYVNGQNIIVDDGFTL